MNVIKDFLIVSVVAAAFIIVGGLALSVINPPNDYEAGRSY